MNYGTIKKKVENRYLKHKTTNTASNVFHHCCIKFEINRKIGRKRKGSVGKTCSMELLSCNPKNKNCFVFVLWKMSTMVSEVSPMGKDRRRDHFFSFGKSPRKYVINIPFSSLIFLTKIMPYFLALFFFVYILQTIDRLSPLFFLKVFLRKKIWKGKNS